MQARNLLGAALAATALGLSPAGTALAEPPGSGPHGGGPGSHEGPVCHDCGIHAGKGGCSHGKGHHGSGMHGDDGHMEMMLRMAEQIGVSEATRKKIAAAAFEARKRSIALEAELEQARLELERLMHEDASDDATVLAQVEAVGRAETALEKHRIQTMLSIRKLLSPQERAKLRSTMKEKHHGRPGAPMGRGRPAAPPPAAH